MSEIALKKHAEPLKKALEDLLKYGPESPRVGICGHIPSYIEYEDLYSLFEGWPEHSGNKGFPVDSYRAYNEDRDNLWQGDNLRKRKSLIEHMLVKLEEYRVQP